ncbi:MAG: threonine synthase [Promethearchaeota archaeon]|jgi:threonine synthase
MTNPAISFHSTNHNAPDVDFKNAILKGQALDKGLYMLNEIPRLPPEQIYSFKYSSLSEIGFRIISEIVGDSIPENDLQNILNSALNFKVPFEKIREKDYICYLDQGPTSSFKDFGAQTLAKLMNYFLKIEDENIVILTATSGDTGSAVAQAFFNMKRIKVVVLFPQEEISDLQRKQMTTLGNNIITLGIKGKFDDCQRIVKRAFADQDLSAINLSSANSINIGRLLPQMLYYFYSYSRIIDKRGEKVIFSVPSGNFGNLMGGLIAFNMGLPVRKFISAVNENDEFPRFLETGIYKKVEPSKKCLSNAMNVGHPSNLARLIDLYNGQIDEVGIMHKNPDIEKIRRDLVSYSISDNITIKTITSFYSKYHKIIEPHGAVGWACLDIYRKKYLEDNEFKSITFETADPAKFPDEIYSILNIYPEAPESIKILKEKKEFPNPVEVANYQDFKSFIQNINDL